MVFAHDTAEMKCREEAAAVLEIVDATLSQMQRDDALVAEYWTLREAFVGAVRDLGSEYALAYIIKELEEKEARHMNKKMAR